ncbi:MarR family winged helix-turn-helix transcriptional regulator [Phytohabitans aurantiacus]|uniref:MarR family transcriptional regulator n=1 Tax=Phytohabitans aurantiacus TaxID=3016789 RepID=A0ABQ5QQA6_9ACTN|nr:MarR family transcriptional regulator [Phytohabitans aurantiacus]GLH96648.1 MarR family transcriptional regulator [Phytohabitans aurantiacus]
MDAPAEPRWLASDERRSWLALTAVIIKLPFALDAQLQRDAGLSHFEYQVMAVLSERPGRSLRMSHLAGFANGSLSRLSHVVNRLEKRGWVHRTPDPEDGRFTLAVLTDSGWDKVVAAAPGHVAAVRKYVYDALTPEQAEQLAEIGHRIVTAIDPDDHCLPPPT